MNGDDGPAVHAGGLVHQAQERAGLGVEVEPRPRRVIEDHPHDGQLLLVEAAVPIFVALGEQRRGGDMGAGHDPAGGLDDLGGREDGGLAGGGIDQAGLADSVLKGDQGPAPDPAERRAPGALAAGLQGGDPRPGKRRARPAGVVVALSPLDAARFEHAARIHREQAAADPQGKEDAPQDP